MTAPPNQNEPPGYPGLDRVGAIVANRSLYRTLNQLSAIAILPVLVVPFAMARSGALPFTLGEMLAVLLPCMLLLAPAHEALHWVAARTVGVLARDCELGFYRAAWMPYFRALVPVRLRGYRIILLTPGVALTLLAAVPALVGNDLRWGLAAVVAFLSGAGDYYWWWRLRTLPADRWVWDRAGIVGLVVLRDSPGDSGRVDTGAGDG